MSILTKVKLLSSVARKPGIITGHSKYLFILSHMRSRSSVLSHILGSNDGICGYSELHISYSGYMNIMKMRIKLYNDLKCELKSKYLLDKIVHNHFDISKEVFEAITPKVLFLLREPESTIRSTIHMGYITGIDWYKNPEKVAEYYCSRLSRLEEYAKIMDGDYFFLESDDLLNKSDHVLRGLTVWLDLVTPLDSIYSEFNNTGKTGYGDFSENIWTGKITKTKGYSDIEIPQDILRLAESSYGRCKDCLMSNII